VAQEALEVKFIEDKNLLTCINQPQLMQCGDFKKYELTL
jgi:hypothetical protein